MDDDQLPLPFKKTWFNPARESRETMLQMTLLIILDLTQRLESGELTEEEAEKEWQRRVHGKDPLC